MNSLKQTTSITIILLIFLLLNLNGSVRADPTVMITDYSLEPETLLPGDYAELTITLTNTETTATHTDTDYINNHVVDQIIDTIAATINEVSITSDGDGTHSIKGQQYYEDIGDLSPGSSITLSIQIRADAKISQGLYYPIIQVNVKDYQDVFYPIPIRVDNLSLSLLHNDVPSKISIGGSTDISFHIVNKRKNTIESITVAPNENNDLDFYPDSIFIGSLDSGNSEEVIISVNPKEIGTQNLSLNLSYLNGHNPHFETYDMSIEVIEVLDVAPIFTSIPLSIKKGSSSRIGLEVYNAKTDSITGVIITPIINTTVIPSQYFIGSMDPDDVFSASFDLYTDMLDYGNHTVKFKVSFKQGSEYYETPSISHSFQVVSSKGVSYQTSSNGDTEASNNLNGAFFTSCLLFIAVIAIIVIVFILWRWKKGRKNQ